MNQSSDPYGFIYRQNRYHGRFTPKTLVFNANLQEFAQRVGHISNLQTNGKLSAQEAYKQIEALWKQLESSYYGLGISPETEND